MINKVFLVGRLGIDPEVRYTPDAVMVVSLSVATVDRWKDKEGKTQSRTEWHKVVAKGDLAEQVASDAERGALLYIEGKIRTRPWEDRDGSRRMTTEIVATALRILESRKSASGEGEDGDGNGDGLPF
jgi:single-strand DNA-binding protein